MLSILQLILDFLILDIGSFPISLFMFEPYSFVIQILKDTTLKKLLIFVITLFILCPIFSEEIDIYHGTASTYNTILKDLYDSDYAIRYETDNEHYYLVTSDYLNQGWIFLNHENIVTLRYILNKYLEWESMAIEKQVAIEKDIPDSRISTKVSWLYGDDYYNSNHFNLYFVFFSQNENWHQLVIKSNKAESSKNEYIDYKLDSLYLNKENVLDLLNSISDKSIEIVINDYNNLQNIEDDFN